MLILKIAAELLLLQEKCQTSILNYYIQDMALTCIYIEIINSKGSYNGIDIGKWRSNQFQPPFYLESGQKKVWMLIFEQLLSILTILRRAEIVQVDVAVD